MIVERGVITGRKIGLMAIAVLAFVGLLYVLHLAGIEL